MRLRVFVSAVLEKSEYRVVFISWYCFKIISLSLFYLLQPRLPPPPPQEEEQHKICSSVSLSYSKNIIYVIHHSYSSICNIRWK